jgi:murein DD-endopeptidase MepM/ murein hydrolase activator NlpD
MKKFRYYMMIYLLICSPFIWSQASMASTSIDVEIGSPVLYQGDLSLIKIRIEKGQEPHVTWMDQDVSLFNLQEENIFAGFIFADLKQNPGNYVMEVMVTPAGQTKRIEVKVEDKEYGVRRLTLPNYQVDLSDENLERALKESAVMKSLWEAPDTPPEWAGPFIMPVDGDIIGPFGRDSIINGQPRSPHSGIDIRGKRGTPVKATNNGTVVLTADHFFAGKSIVLDHGAGIRSMYFHLSEIMVKVGDKVSKGSDIGLVGSTGRASGPHLHWGIRIKDARVDPMRLIDRTKNLEE